ncbi:hypothetical protein [Halobacillus amylolyticus]|uniref:Integrase n=1 Tax=Halobacillus amylolyticus TaxID=2932259 RepID=A0ABY4HB75_9BACI|nr:hypothetical protein [Halobacillus amylolyticus]UOR10655.1 hypothetical protein MUO15_13425 [Halobacillus amylolyticus]
MYVEQSIKESNIAVVQLTDYYSMKNSDVIETFNLFCRKEVIQASSFEDRVWKLNNEKNERVFNFDIDEVQYQKVKESLKLPTYKDIINALKAFILLKLDNNAIEGLCDLLNLLKKVITETNFFDIELKKELSIKRIEENNQYYTHLTSLIDFLDYSPFNNVEEYLDLLYFQSDSYWKHNLNTRSFNQREIGNFRSVFELGFVLDTFWETCSSEEKEKFFPIRLWWEITTTIPIRVAEFALTPYDCLKKKDGGYFLVVRRTKLKGSSSKIKHKVEEDYELQEIRINQKLYRLIKEYRDMVDEYDMIPDFYYKGYQFSGKRRYLLSYRAYFKHLHYKGIKRNRSKFLDFFHMSHLNHLLKCFYNEVVGGKFNYEIVPKGTKDDIYSFQIEFTNLMDTRHFAFINMVLNDVEPLLIKQISGHSSISSSYHYYSHVDKFVECYTYNMAKRMAKKKQVDEGNSIIDVRRVKHSEVSFKKVFDSNYEDAAENHIDIQKGKCSSQQEQFEDCMKVDNDCYVCPYFHPNETMAEQSIRDKISKNQNSISTESLALKELVMRYSQNQNFNEDYRLKMNRIKMMANQNATMLSEHYFQGEVSLGK